MRVRGTFGRWSLAGIYYYGYDDAGVTRGVDFFPDDERGIDFGFGCCLVLELDTIYPRVNNIGATGNRYFQGVDGVFNFEFRLTPDQVYSDAAGPFQERSTLTYSLGFAKNFSLKALNYGRSFNMGFQFQQISIVGGRDNLEGLLSAGGTPVNKDNFLINYTVGTGYKNDNIQPFFLLLWDPEGAALVRPLRAVHPRRPFEVLGRVQSLRGERRHTGRCLQGLSGRSLRLRGRVRLEDGLPVLGSQ